MKKLLALVLCVMMFVSVLSTTAFADNRLPQAADPTKTWPALSASKTAVENAQKNLDHIYGTLAADSAVFESIKSIDSFVGDLTKSLLDGVDDFTTVKRDDITGRVTSRTVLSHDTLVDNAKAYLRGIIGNSIIDELNDNRSNFVSVSKAKFNGENMYRYTDRNDPTKTYTLRYVGTEDGAYVNGQKVNLPATAKGSKIFVGNDNCIYGLDSNGEWWYADLYTAPQAWTKMSQYGYDKDDMNFVPNYTYDPVKYLDEYAKAASKALSSEKAVKGLQGTIYNLYVLKAMDQARDDMDDFWTDVNNWDKDNAILKAYGFNGTDNLFDLYAFDDANDLPKSINLPGSLFVPGDLDVTLFN
jgi:hypothetical protein